MATILDIETEQFSNSESLCHPDASHQVLAQSDLPFGRRCGLKNFKNGGHLGYWNIKILAILNLHNTPMPLSSLSSVRLTVQEQMSFEDFQDGWPSWISE